MASRLVEIEAAVRDTDSVMSDSGSAASGDTTRLRVDAFRVSCLSIVATTRDESS